MTALATNPYIRNTNTLFGSEVKTAMTTKQRIFVPGKNPNPEEALHSKLLWRTLAEGVRRADSSVACTLQDSYAQFHLLDWNGIYYHSHHDIYNIFRGDEGLDCHRSYGYMISPAGGSIIADWWKPCLCRKDNSH
jgi:hypothetical protein